MKTLNDRIVEELDRVLGAAHEEIAQTSINCIRHATLEERIEVLHRIKSEGAFKFAQEATKASAERNM